MSPMGVTLVIGECRLGRQLGWTSCSQRPPSFQFLALLQKTQLNPGQL